MRNITPLASMKAGFFVLTFGILGLPFTQAIMGMESDTPSEQNTPLTSTEDSFSKLLYDADRLNEALKNDSSLINKQDEKGNTLLHHLAQGGLMSGRTTLSPLFETMFSFQPNMNIFNGNDITPLHIAAACCYERVSECCVFPNFLAYAVKNHFDPNPANKDGITPLHLAASRSYDHWIMPQHPTRHYLNPNIVPDLSLIDLNAMASGDQTPLHWAFLNGEIKNTTCLIEAGADIALFPNDPNRSARSKYPFACLVDSIKGTSHQAQHKDAYQLLLNEVCK